MALTEWHFADAKKRFSALVRRALTQGPQRVRWRDEAVVVLDAKAYERSRRAAFELQAVPDEGPQPRRRQPLSVHRQGTA